MQPLSLLHPSGKWDFDKNKMAERHLGMLFIILPENKLDRKQWSFSVEWLALV